VITKFNPLQQNEMPIDVKLSIELKKLHPEWVVRKGKCPRKGL